MVVGKASRITKSLSTQQSKNAQNCSNKEHLELSTECVACAHHPGPFRPRGSHPHSKRGWDPSSFLARWQVSMQFPKRQNSLQNGFI